MTFDPPRRPGTPFGPLAGPEAPPPRERSYWIVEGRLLAGIYPFAVDPVDGRRALAELSAAGVDTFVDLTQAGMAGAPDAHLTNYRTHLAEGTVALRFPIRDLSLPEPDRLNATLDAIDGALSEGRNVYVHCWAGVGRTGLVAATWLMRHVTADPIEALDVLDRLRRADRGAADRRSPETEEQREFVMRWQPTLGS